MAAKARYKELLEQVPLITEDEIDIDGKTRVGEDSIVYQSLWQGHAVAFKNWKIVPEEEQTVEQFTKGFRYAHLIVLKCSSCIANALGIKKAGAVVMKWELINLKAWYQRQFDHCYD